MPAEETPPGSPSVHLDSDDDHLDENDVIEMIDDDDDDDDDDDVIVSEVGEEDIIDSDTEEATGIVIDSDGETDQNERIPERDDAQIIFNEHKGEVLCCHFHPKSNDIVVTGGVDDSAFIWDSSNGNKLFSCKGHEESVELASFSYDGSYLATGDLNGVIKVWRTRDFESICTLELDDELSWMQWHSGINVLVASSQVGMIYMYKIPSAERKMVMASFGQKCLAGKILSDGKTLACGYKDGSLKIVDLRQGMVLKDVKLLDETGGITCLDVHKNNSLIICGCECGSVMIINSNTGKIASVLQGSQNSDGSNYIEVVSFCKDPYPVAASGSLDGTLVIWDIVRQTMRHKYNFHSCVIQLIWHPNLTVLFTCHVEGVAHAFDAKTGVILKEYLGHKKSCLSMSLSSDGSLLMTTSEDKTVRIYSVGNIV